jgi:endonuclease/exonuclease/phosphatase family metal-dependent hydrolase
VTLLVRTWNVFHGNAVPPTREGHLIDAIRLATSDEPDVLCLQELPTWALGRLAEWSGMTVFGEIAAPPTIGPLPSTPELGRLLGKPHPGRLRSLFSGQANAILVAPRFRPLSQHVLVLNASPFRRRQARWLRLPLVARLAWAKERRIVQAVRLAETDGAALLVANLHATAYRPDERLADAELLRAAVWADALDRPGDVCVLAGDFNVFAARSWTLRDLSGPGWGFSKPGAAGVDHVLVRGAEAGAAERWPPERRRVEDVLLSDHAPVEVRIG